MNAEASLTELLPQLPNTTAPYLLPQLDGSADLQLVNAQVDADGLR